MPGRALGVSAVSVLVGAGCVQTLDELDEIYSRGADRAVLCGMNVDDKNAFSTDAIGEGLDRARLRGEVLHLYAHYPAGTIQISTIEAVLAAASDRGVPTVTYRQLAGGTTGAGLALSFDDHDLVGWTAMRPLFDHYGARITFFVDGYLGFDAAAKALLADLAADGHDLEYHSVSHLNAEEYAAAHGVAGYLADDIQPGLDAMRADGWEPIVFAYPYGARTADTDAALLGIFTHLRAIHSTCPDP